MISNFENTTVKCVLIISSLNYVSFDPNNCSLSYLFCYIFNFYHLKHSRYFVSPSININPFRHPRYSWTTRENLFKQWKTIGLHKLDKLRRIIAYFRVTNCPNFSRLSRQLVIICLDNCRQTV